MCGREGRVPLETGGGHACGDMQGVFALGMGVIALETGGEDTRVVICRARLRWEWECLR